MALAYQRLTYSRGKGIYVVRSRALHASHQRLLTNGEDATQGIFGNWGAALDAGYVGFCITFLLRGQLSYERSE